MISSFFRGLAVVLVLGVLAALVAGGFVVGRTTGGGSSGIDIPFVHDGSSGGDDSSGAGDEPDENEVDNGSTGRNDDSSKANDERDENEVDRGGNEP